MSPRPALTSRATGVALVGLGAVGFGFVGIFSSLAYDDGANAPAVILVRALGALPLLFLLASAARRRELRRGATLLGPMALLATANVTTYFVAVERMAPALVTLIVFAYPALALVGSRLLGWSVLDGLAGLVAATTILGVALTIGMPSGGVDPLAVALSLANAFGYATYLLLAQAALRHVEPLTCWVAAGGASSLLLLPGAFILGDVTAPSGPVGLGSLLAIGILSAGLPAVLQLRGIVRLGSATTALVACLEIVTVVVASVIVLDDPIRGGAIGGCVLVLAGAFAAPLVLKQRPRPVVEGLRATAR